MISLTTAFLVGGSLACFGLFAGIIIGLVLGRDLEAQEWRSRAGTGFLYISKKKCYLVQEMKVP